MFIALATQALLCQAHKWWAVETEPETELYILGNGFRQVKIIYQATKLSFGFDEIIEIVGLDKTRLGLDWFQDCWKDWSLKRVIVVIIVQ